MPFRYDDFYSSSPSTHAVPCSPHIARTHESPSRVPDIDNSLLRGISDSHVRGRHVTSRIPASHNDITTIQQFPQSTRPISEDSLLKTHISSQIFEQVVPCCSPFISQVETLGSKQESQDALMIGELLSQKTDGSQSQFLHNDTKIDNGCSNFVPTDEKPALKVAENKRRHKRHLDSSQSVSVKNIDLFQGDDIFD